MNAWENLRSRLHAAVSGLLPGGDSGPEPRASDPSPDGFGESGEFEDLLQAVGAEGPADGDEGPDLRDVTIRELQSQLEDLRDLGDRLAEAEKARLAAEAEVERLRETGADDDAAKLRAEVRRLERQLERREARIANMQERIDALRAKADERHKTAVDRWHELRRVKGERRESKDELSRTRRRLAEIEGSVQTLVTAEPDEAQAAGARLVDLMGLDDES